MKPKKDPPPRMPDCPVCGNPWRCPDHQTALPVDRRPMPETAPGPDVPDGMRLEDVPADLLDLAWDAWGSQSPDDELGAVRATLAAVLPAHKRQVREQALRDLDAGRIAAEDLAAAGLQVGHVVDLRDDGWTVQHPLTCGADLFGCPVNRAAERDLTGPPHEFGRFECGVEGGEFWIGEAR